MSITAKSILWVFLIATVAGASLWLVGGKKQEYSAAIQIEASPQVVFTFLTEPEKHKSWATGLIYVEQFQPNTDDSAAKRITSTRVTSTDGRETTFEDQVIRFEPEKSLTVQSTNHACVITSIFRLESNENQSKQTNLSYRVIKLNRGFNRLLAPIISDDTQHRIDENIRNLKRIVESDSQP